MTPAQHLLAPDFSDLEPLLKEWHSQFPGAGVVVLVPEAEKERVPLIQARCRELGMPLAGAIFPALVNDDGFPVTGAWLLRFETLPPHFLLTTAADGKAVSGLAVAAATADLLQQVAGNGGVPTLFLIFDGMIPNIASILHDASRILVRQVRYGGVNAGSETFQPMPCLFDGERVVGNGVLGLLLPAGTPVRVRHDYPVSRALMTATSTVGNRVISIDGRPAFEVYQNIIRAEYGVDLTQANFYDYAVHFPFGIVTVIDVLVRIPVAFGEDGSIFCVGEVPPNSRLRLLRAPLLENSQCVDRLAAEIGEGRDAQRGHPMLTFYCAGRRMHLGADATTEVARLKQATGASALHGALTLGEIDTLEDMGIPRFHNATLVCLPGQE